MKILSPNTRITYVGERKGHFAHVLRGNKDIDKTYRIFSGKYRRYHGETLAQKMLDIKTIILNLRDIGFVIIGIVQSLVLLALNRPDVVFLKGGYVGVPIGLAAALYRIPIVTHDSDAVAGLANRMVSRWATLHATALPIDQYAYPARKTLQTGVIVSDEYQFVDESTKQGFRRELALSQDAKILFVTGGSSGAVAINEAISSIIEEIIELDSDVYVIHQVGKGKQGIYKKTDYKQLEVHEFIDGLYKYSGAADLIITRAGANTLAEFAVQAKPCIVIPSPHLAGGHQLENAKFVRDRQAAIVLDEQEMLQDPSMLKQSIADTLLDKETQKKLANSIQKLARLDASKVIAQKLQEIAKNSKKHNNT